MSSFSKATVASLSIFFAFNAQAASDKVQQLIEYDMIGSDLRYFESIAGVARKSYDWTYNYVVDGCRIQVTAPQAHTINKIRIELTEQCQPDFSDALASFAPDTKQPLTIGNFANSFGDLSFTADCLSGCGNAADPYIYAYWQGPRAFELREVMLEVVQVATPALEAADKWQALMEQHEGEDWVMDTQFNCNHKYDTQAQQFFNPVQVTAVTIGYDLRNESSCQ